MFKLTCFSPVSAKEIGKLLKGFRFKNIANEFVWEVDGHVFRIVPFGPQGNSQTQYGYRVYFNGSIDGGLYLFELSMGCLKSTINAVEYDISLEEWTQDDWITDLLKRPSYKPQQIRGIFSKGNVNVICLPNNIVNLQLRKKHSKAFKLIELLKEVESIKEELEPVEFDLFSTFEEVVAI
ncbi:hypothetical protein K7887_22450 (plasmid) [Sutcliffiella horikoshii]|uniref:hypothetical protein n=1 Tax=Sutcliffiella horikoshii TaxID=79883 RepID=UPI001CC0AF88|nr:hypothetical protein [Sutcliffiella horikoshii]UAL49881.1 hypothetical protein K7887_22450 [Sutcliffiella horikoshii]